MYKTNKLPKTFALIFLICIQRLEGYAVRERSILQDPHIVGGVDTPIEVIPYQASLEVLNVDKCGAVIVSESWVLTAAHCFGPKISGPPWKVKIGAGSKTQVPDIGRGGSLHQIETMEYHPKFNFRQLDYDIAVVKVLNKFLLNSRIKPIAVPTQSENEFLDYSKNVTVSGWGSIKVGVDWPSIFLKSALIPLVPRRICQEVAQRQNLEVSPRMICGAGTGRSDTNWGDSGGPVVQKDRLIGLVSWGMRHMHPTLPSVFTNLLHPEIRLFIKNKCQV